MGKNWHDPAEMAKENAIYAAWVLVLAGVAAWDVLRTLPFDWTIISGQRKWRWPMALYFAARICMLIHIFAYAVNLNAISRIDCDVVVWMSKITDFVGTCISSIILGLRTTAVWGQDKRVTIPLAVLCLVQVLLWTQTMRYSKSIWNPQRKICQIMSTSPVPLLVAVWSFTMALDFVIMVLCSFKLWRTRNNSGISALLLRDGMLYFAAAFTANLLQTTLAALSLNPIMNIIALPFTLVVSVIAATTVFRNVFTMYDDFTQGSNTRGGSTTSGLPSSGPLVTFGGTPRNGGQRSRGLSTAKASDTYSLGQIKTDNLGGIEVHRMVDIERDAQPTYPEKRPTDDSRSSLTDREDKPVAL